MTHFEEEGRTRPASRLTSINPRPSASRLRCALTSARASCHAPGVKALFLGCGASSAIGHAEVNLAIRPWRAGGGGAALAPSAWWGGRWLLTPPTLSRLLERVQEREELIPRPGTQPCEAVAGPLSLAIVCKDCRSEARRAPVVEETRPHPDTPQWGGANLAAGGRALDDAVAEAAHVVEQEIRERLEHLAR